MQLTQVRCGNLKSRLRLDFFSEAEDNLFEMNNICLFIDCEVFNEGEGVDVISIIFN